MYEDHKGGNMKRYFIILLAFVLLAGFKPATYEEAVAGWTSYEDVAHWLKTSFRFSTSRQRAVAKLMKEDGRDGLRYRNPAKLYKKRSGYCVDAAYFAVEALNRVNPDYNARTVFILNKLSKTHHWVAAFDLGGKLYIMDYGAGPKWNAMNGIHGPYDSLDEYREFLESRRWIKGFKVADVYFRDLPGEED